MINTRIFLSCFLSLTFLLVGCEKDMQDIDMPMEGDELVPLNIVVGGMEDYGDVISPETRSEETMVQSFVQPLDSTKDTGIDVVTTIEMLPANKTVQTRAAMNNNAIFRMLTYNSSKELIYDNIYKIGSNKVTLISGTTPILTAGNYKFVCYTYNRNNLPALINNAAFVSTWDDFATCVLEKQISGQDNKVEINFKRHCCFLTLDVVASGFSDNTVNLESTGLGNEAQATFPIDNSVTDKTALTLMSNFASHVYYGPTPIVPDTRTLTIVLNQFTIGGVRYSKWYEVPVNFVRRGNYKITIKFTPKIDDSITLGGLKWAKGNLRYVNGVYRFAESQEQYTNNNGTWNAITNPDYFAWNTLTLTTTSLNNGDPCSEVHPKGIWRTPTKADFEKIVALPTSRGSYKGIRGVYFGVSEEPSSDAKKEQTLFLPYCGFREFTGTSMGNADLGGDYWSSNSYTSSMGYYLVLYRPEGIPFISQIDKNRGKAIRCVR